jgi:hypothetical protein
VGLEAVIVGAALGCFREDRRRRAHRLLQQRMGPRSWLMMEMPDD